MAVDMLSVQNVTIESGATGMHIWPEEPIRQDGFVTLSASIECGGIDRRRLWYRVPEEYSGYLTESCDAFLIGLIFMAMEQKAPVHVHGQVSPRLLENLAEFQMVWQRWHPTKYVAVEITADLEREQPAVLEAGKAVCAFTGGIDSSFTVYRHKTQQCGRLGKNVEAGLFVHGFDVPLADQHAFERAASTLKKTLSSIDLNLITMATNHKDLNPDWNFTHGAGIVSCLALLSCRYDHGLLGATYTYRLLDKSWGSHPLTDRFLSTGNFQVIHDAAGYGRASKLKIVSQWSEAYENLRVCWSAARKDENCGRCGKCVMTMLVALYNGLAVPTSFPDGVCEETILQLRELDAEHTNLMELALGVFKNSKVPHALVQASQRCVKYNKRRLDLEKVARNPVEGAFRRYALNLHAWQGP